MRQYKAPKRQTNKQKKLKKGKEKQKEKKKIISIIPIQTRKKLGEKKKEEEEENFVPGSARSPAKSEERSPGNVHVDRLEFGERAQIL